MVECGRFCVFGDWDQTPTPVGKLRITMVPLCHVAGCGWEPHTKAALLALPDHVTPGCSFADIGCGSGILTVAAKLLGASQCYATELDREALVAAPKVFAANKVEGVNLIDGSFVDAKVDLAVVSISTGWYGENYQRIKAKKTLVVHDDATVEVLTGKPKMHTHKPPDPRYEGSVVIGTADGGKIRLFKDGTWEAVEE